jgi:hypothetical protein
MPSHDQTTNDDQTNDDDDQTTEPRTFDLFEVQSQDPTDTFGGLTLDQIGSSYGTGAIPMFQWVQKIKVGESTYDERDDVDTKMMKRYEDFVEKYGQPSDFPSPQELLTKASGTIGAQFGGLIGEPLGVALATNQFSGVLPFGKTGALDIGPGQYVLDGKVSDLAKGATLPDGAIEGINPFKAQAENITPGDFYDFAEGGTGRTAVAGSVGGAVANFGVQLAMGEDPASAARKAGATAIAGHVAKSLLVPIFGPIGGVLGGIAGALIGGRVICNELHKQGLLTKEQVLMDYKFTRDYLTPTHVNGYHLWAVWVVRQMRKGRMIKFWKHIATHRANEIAYIYGKKEKPDYLGKIYRRVLEPVCWLLGTFTKATDWSVLYKENKNG